MDEKFPPNKIDYKIIDLWHLKSRKIESEFPVEILDIMPQLEPILHLNGQYIQIYDTTTMGYAFISKSNETVLGYSLEEIKAKKALFMFEIYCSADAKASTIIHDQIREHGMMQPVNIRHHFRYTNTFRAKHKNGHYIWLLNHLIYLASLPDGTPHLMLSYATDISHIKNNDHIPFSISKYNPLSTSYELQREPQVYNNNGEALLSNREREVLRYLANGLTNEEISSKMSIKVSTILDHRKNMLKKTDTSNICELFTYASKKNLL